MLKTPHKYDEFIAECAAFADEISARSQDIFELLKDYETHSTIEHEINSSIDSLRGVRQELQSIKKPKSDLIISVFIPLNLPLYSLVLYGIIPSAFSKSIFIRPPEVMHGVLPAIMELLGVGTKHFKAISIQEVPRHTFVDLFASESDVILFTGKYENAISIHEQCPQALLIYEGSGVCPLIVCDNADLDLAVDKAIAMRCFNSGQDCVAPDAMFVPSHLAKAFTDQLTAKLARLKVGNSADPKVAISKIIKTVYINEIEKWLLKERSNLIFGGQIDIKNSYVYPTVILKNSNDHKGAFHEFFAPIFYVLTYDDTKDLKRLFHSPEFSEQSMYMSIFGRNVALERYLPKATILRNTIVNDIENGNAPYGGWSMRANSLLYGKKKIVRPVLISRDIHDMLD